jgi:subtilase family serine protease
VKAIRRFVLVGALVVGWALPGVPSHVIEASARATVRPAGLHRVYVGRGAPTTQDCQQSIGIACYAPAQLQQAYDMTPLYAGGLDGAGATIALVDAFGSPSIERDLSRFDQAFGLPAPPSFQIIAPAGSIPPFDKHNDTMQGWAGETTLDVEWAHAMAPGASILLVETPIAETLGVQGFPEIVKAENFVIDNGLADVISQSFGATEPTFPNEAALTSLRSAFQNAEAKSVTVLASSGDAGSTGPSNLHGGYYPIPTVGWPASDPLVTAVGGTHLQLDADGNRTAPDEVWNESFDKLIAGPRPSPVAAGGGVSMFFDRPNFQDGVSATTGLRRGIPDVSLSAAVDGGVLVYQSIPGTPKGFYIVGGTSEASPLFAGIVAIADQKAGHPLGFLDPLLYSLAAGKGVVDVTAGDNHVAYVDKKGRRVVVPGYTAVAGYDLASGLGTVDGSLLVNALAP